MIQMHKKTRNRNQLNKAAKRCCSIFSGIKKISAGHKICIATVAMKIAKSILWLMTKTKLSFIKRMCQSKIKQKDKESQNNSPVMGLKSIENIRRHGFTNSDYHSNYGMLI